VAPAHEEQALFDPVGALANTCSSAAETAAFVVTFTSTTLSFEIRTWTDQFEDWMTVRGDLWVMINRKLEQEMWRWPSPKSRAP